METIEIVPEIFIFHSKKKADVSLNQKPIEIWNVHHFSQVFPAQIPCSPGFSSHGDLPPASTRYDMGSDGEFEFRRQELAHMAGCEEEDIGDEEVMQSYKEWQGMGDWMGDWMFTAWWFRTWMDYFP